MDDELLDVLGEDGTPLGIARRRDAVHRDGDWHAAFHLWVVSAEGVLLQRRARAKASWPGYLDASAAGHLLAGESVADGLREVEEELGVAYAFDQLTALGAHRVDERGGEGRRNRELQQVFAVRDDRPLDKWSRFERAEIDELVLIGHMSFSDLTRGGRAQVAAHAFDGVGERNVTVHEGELVPAPYLASLASLLMSVAGCS